MKKIPCIVLVFVFLPVVIFAGGNAEDASPDVSFINGVVEYLEGDVFINSEKADFGAGVPYGSIIKTEADSYCEIIFENKNVFRIMESTVAEIRLSVEAPEIIIDKGSFAALFTKLTAFVSDEPFKVKTQTMFAGVRGTAFFVKVEDPDSTYICICNGKLGMTTPDNDTETSFASNHHKAAYYRLIDGEIEVSAAPLLYHTDEDMNMLASRIDEKIQWDYSSSY